MKTKRFGKCFLVATNVTGTLTAIFDRGEFAPWRWVRTASWTFRWLDPPKRLYLKD